MCSYVKLIGIAWVSILLTACSSEGELELSNYQTGIYLTIKPAKSTAVLVLDNESSTSLETYAHEVDPTLPLVATKAGQIIRISLSELESYKAEGYKLENEQKVEAFGTTLSGAYADFLHYEKLWQLSQGEGITLALIDSGISQSDEFSSASVFAGYDFIAEQEGALDESGHGTAVAALIVGQGRIKGIAPKANILPLKVLNAQDQGSSFDVIRALYYAADLLPELRNPNKADIINLSLGSMSYSPGIHDAIKKLGEEGIVVVAAVGNVSGKVAFPAILPEVIAVGAAELTLAGWQLSPYSGFGESMDILVPMSGVNQKEGEATVFGLESVDFTGQAKPSVGTSFAAPQVTGLLALLRAKGVSPAEATRALRESSSDLFMQGVDKESGYGLFDPWAAIRSSSAPNVLSRFALQVLDSQSLQESYYAEFAGERFISLRPGSYHLVIWEDLNQDGLWNRDKETVYQTLSNQPIKVLEGETMQLNAQLH